MKFTKLSLAAMIAMGVASSAFAVENVKVDGQIKLWYQTADISSVAGILQILYLARVQHKLIMTAYLNKTVHLET